MSKATDYLKLIETRERMNALGYQIIESAFSGLDVSRGCCEVKADSTVCPTGKTMDHYDDRDRYYCYCKGPLCNTVECKADDNPTTPSGNNGGNGHHNGVIVPGKSGANPFIKANVKCLVISLAIYYIMS